MPKFKVNYEVTCVVSGQIEIEAESEIQAKLLVEGADLGELESGAEIESYFAEVKEVTEVAS